MGKKHLTVLLIVLAVLVFAGIVVYAAAGYGTEDDPLITKSYLDSVVQPELEQTLQEELDAAIDELRDGDGQFHLLTLQNGQRVTCEVGTEVLLRFGSAKAYAYDSGDVAMVDMTSASSLSVGTALSVNHLCMVTIEGNGFTAAANNTKVLISGSHTVN